jgi:hypothetical protein
MNPEQKRRLAFYLDGLHYSFEFASIAYDRLLPTLDSVAQRNDTGRPFEREIASALLDIWSLIDSIHRIRELIQQTPSLPKLTQVGIFLRSTNLFPELRNHIQHLRNEIPAIGLTSFPLWGAVSWVPSFSKNTCYTALTGNFIHGVQAMTCTFDTQERCFPSKLMVFAGGASECMDMAFSQVCRLRVALRKWATDHPEIETAQRETLLLVHRF